MIPTILISMLLSSSAQAKADQSIQWISEAEVKELHNALESYYLSCGFYPSELAELTSPLPNHICKNAESSAPYSDPDGSRAKKILLMAYYPKNPKKFGTDFQNYDITFRILESK